LSSEPGNSETPKSVSTRVLDRLRGGAYLIDPKFSRNRSRYVIQCLMVTCTMLVVLLVLDAFYQTVLIAALGASSFIAFAAPSMRASRPRCLIGGYVIGMTIGCCLSSIVGDTGSLVVLDEHSTRILLGAIAVGGAMFVMVTTDTEHPPAAAIALGFVLNEWDWMTVVVVLAGIVTISAVKELTRKYLMDLL
jgi:CBS-domain-containing membrane protein